ncbi:MAG TPA: RNA-binding protein [Rhizomicrobium sp.]|jgi:hypothetical protein
MTAQPALSDPEALIGSRERRCIVTRETHHDACLIRFVVDPQGVVVPDLAAKLPGRGMWVSARREILERAIVGHHFSRAAHAPVDVPPDLPQRIEKLLVARMSGDLGLARRAGQLVLGFDSIARALAGGASFAALVEACDGAPDGKRKLRALARALEPFIIDCLTSAELSLAVGRENVIHAALKSGRISERLTADAGRLGGFRPARKCRAIPAPDAAGSKPAGSKGLE